MTSSNCTQVTAATYALYMPMSKLLALSSERRWPISFNPYSGFCITLIGEIAPLIIAGKSFEHLQKKKFNDFSHAFLSGFLAAPLMASANNILTHKLTLDVRLKAHFLRTTYAAAFLNIFKTQGISGFFIGFNAVSIASCSLSLNMFCVRPRLEKEIPYLGSVGAATMHAMIYQPALRFAGLQHVVTFINKPPDFTKLAAFALRHKNFFLKGLHLQVISQTMLMSTYTSFEKRLSKQK